MRKAKTITLKGDEAVACAHLRAWAGCDDAARFVLAVLASRPVVAGADPQKWFVPSASSTARQLTGARRTSAGVTSSTGEHAAAGSTCWRE